MDISAVSEPILIKQSWFYHLNCMFFQIWHSVFHYPTQKLFCVVHSATELNYPFNKATMMMCDVTYEEFKCLVHTLFKWSLFSFFMMEEI